MKRTIATLLLLAWVAGCEPNTGSDAQRVEGLALSLSPVDHAGPECRIRQTARVDQARLPLYRVEGLGVYRSNASDHIARIPVQIQFRGLEGVQTQQVTTLTGIDADCRSVQIEWRLDHCIGHDREAMTCPEVNLVGGQEFASVNVAITDD